eukprot:UN13100
MAMKPYNAYMLFYQRCTDIESECFIEAAKKLVMI